MIGFIWIFPHLGLLPIFIYPFVVLFVVWLYLKLNGEQFKDIGFRFSQLGWQPFIIGSAIGLGYAILDYWLLGPFMINIIGLRKANIADFNFVRNSIFNLLYILAIAWLIGVPYEEIVFRGFIFTRLRAMIKGKWRYGICVLITSLLFAMYHFQQGASGVFNAFVFSLVISLVYRVYKGNLWYVIFFHAMYDTFMLTMIHLRLI